MNPDDTLLTILISAVIWTWILYLVIRRAVCGGILDAQRKREQAEAERQLVIRQRATGQAP